MKISDFKLWTGTLPINSYVLISTPNEQGDGYDNYKVDLSQITVSGEGSGSENVEVDLSNYCTYDWVERLIRNALDNYYTKTEVNEKFDNSLNEIYTSLNNL